MKESLAPWRSVLARALHHNRSLPHSRYIQLATVRCDGKTSNRTLVFRGFREQSNQLQFVSDTRSSKIPQIQANPWGEICWYFTQTREQFRILGKINFIDGLNENMELLKIRQELWQKLSDSGKLQFAWPEPGVKRSETFPVTITVGESPLANFCILLFEPTEIDHLELRGNPQNRCRYFLDDNGGWITTAINP